MQGDQEDPRPLYYQVKEMIRSGIMHGDWKPNELLPTEEAFCKRLGISRITVARAIKELVNEGLIYRVQGKGTYVADPAEQSESSKTIGLVLHRTEVHSESYFYDTIQGIDDLLIQDYLGIEGDFTQATETPQRLELELREGTTFDMDVYRTYQVRVREGKVIGTIGGEPAAWL